MKRVPIEAELQDTKEVNNEVISFLTVHFNLLLDQCPQDSQPPQHCKILRLFRGKRKVVHCDGIRREW